MVTIQTEMPHDHYDLLGVGLGPANLSLAALLSGDKQLKLQFVDTKNHPNWHVGLMFHGAQMQTSFLEDLVTPVDPTNPLSFMAYLAATGRIFEFLCRNTTTTSRMEFHQYLNWAAGQLRCLGFGETVQEVTVGAQNFEVRTSQRRYHVRSLALGVGKVPLVPEWARALLSTHCFHVEEVLKRRHILTGARVIVVGGGQSAADLMTALLAGELGDAAEIQWITRRGNLQGLDDSPFVNEFHTPQYTNYFYGLDDGVKRRLLADQKLFGDGITRNCLEHLYEAIYRRNYIEGPFHSVCVYPHCEVVDLAGGPGAFTIGMQGVSGARSMLSGDVIILCTGYEDRLPGFLEPLRSRIGLTESGQYVLTKNYRLAWDGPARQAIYALNAGRHTHGIADSYLCLAAWRAAQIANDILGWARYPSVVPGGFMRWDGKPPSTLEVTDRSAGRAEPDVQGGCSSAARFSAPSANRLVQRAPDGCYADRSAS